MRMAPITRETGGGFPSAGAHPRTPPAHEMAGNGRSVARTSGYGYTSGMEHHDPRLARLRAVLEQRPARRAARSPGVREAAVAVVLRPRESIEVLLIQRAIQENDPWSGHMAFPGGRRDPDDPDLIATAFRETSEETGVPLARTGKLIGALDEVAPANPRLPPILIAPFVTSVPPDTDAVPNPREVQAAIWVPLPALRDESAATSILVRLEGGSLSFPALRYGDYEIWGLTRRILLQFLEVAREAGI